MVQSDAVHTSTNMMPSTHRPVIAARWRRKRRQPSCQRRQRVVSASTGRGSVVVDARVDEDIGEINQEIGQDEERREHQDDPLDHRIIARKNRLHQ